VRDIGCMPFPQSQEVAISNADCQMESFVFVLFYSVEVADEGDQLLSLLVADNS